MKITGADWKRLFERLDALLEAPPAERAVLLDAIANDAPQDAERLRALLADEVDLSVQGTPLPPLAVDLNSPAQSRVPLGGGSAWLEGATVGPYRLIRQIGRGGMSTVWLAVRGDGAMRRPLALKLPHRFVDGARGAARFDREREILEALTHPHIARLYDAGVDAGGQPYLGMEYVEGVSLLEYCNGVRLTVRERLNVFLQVLGAVRYAHAHLVIHRDLKPSNILVTADQQVRLLDFGIAKLTVESGDRATALTQHGGRALTPDYASPEQIAGLPLSTGSDVYSLGVVLFELLTGRRPYKLARDSRGALEDAILSADPPHLHQSVTSDHAEVCRTRETQLRAELKGELDAIVMKALKKLPAERYGTAEGFAQDLARYLRHETVFARPDSAWYRLQKFLRRNRLIVAGAAAVLAALGSGLGVAVWQARIAREQARTAEVVQTFMVNLFRANSTNQTDPIKARQLTARELLDVGAAQIHAALKDTPQAELRVLKTLSDMYDELGLTDQLMIFARKRVEVARSLGDRNDPRLAEALVELGNSAQRVDLQVEAGRAYTEAEAILGRAGDHASQAYAELETSLAYYYEGVDAEEALAHVERGVAAWRRQGKPQYLVNAISGKAMFSIDAGQFSAAVAAATEALGMATALGPAANDQLLQIHEALGYAHWGLGTFAAGETEFRRAAAIAAAGTGDVVMEKLETLGPLADFLLDTGRMEGLDLLRDLQGDIAGLQGDRAAASRPARTVLRYGRALVNYGQFEAGIAELARAGHAPGFTPSAEFTAELDDAQANAMLELGRYTDAAALLLQAETAHRKAGEWNTVYRNATVALRAHLLLAQGKPAEANLALDAYLAGDAAAADVARVHLEPLILRADIALAQGDLDRALGLANQVLTRVTTSQSRRYLAGWEMQASERAGMAHLLGHRPREAQPLLARAEELSTQLHDPDASPRHAALLVALAECALDLEQPGAARALLTRARTIHAGHRELAAHFTVPLERVAARVRI